VFFSLRDAYDYLCNHTKITLIIHGVNEILSTFFVILRAKKWRLTQSNSSLPVIPAGSGSVTAAETTDLLDETRQLIAIFTTIDENAKG
jgi:hypothetical protein